MQRGTHHSQEVVEKLRKQKLGKPHGHKTSNGGGWKLTERMKKEIGKRNKVAIKKYFASPIGIERRKRISEWMQGRMVGSKNPIWKGGITPFRNAIHKSSEYKIWRNAVFLRDNWTCVFCGQRGVRLEADHIKPFALFPELRFAIDNGRTLCKPCHQKTPTYGFQKGYTPWNKGKRKNR